MIRPTDIPMLFSGFYTNLLIAALSCILPIGVGFLATLAHNPRKKRNCPAWGLFECVVPLAWLLVLAFGVFPWMRSVILPSVLVFTVSHMGYIPLHKREGYAFKDFLASCIDLFVSIFMWTTVIGYVAGRDVVKVATIIQSRTFSPTVFVCVAGALFVFLLILQVIRYLLLGLIPERIEMPHRRLKQPNPTEE